MPPTNKNPGLAGPGLNHKNLGEHVAAASQFSEKATALVGRDLIGHTVEQQLDAALYRLLSGECGLHDLTPALQGFYASGFWDGQESLRARLESAEDVRDQLYERIHGGTDYPELRLRRMRAAAEDYWREFVDSAVDTQIEGESR